MVQAPTSVPAGVDHRNPITPAAADILDLINSRPTSPRLEEIEKIIARIPNVLTPMAAECAGGDKTIDGEPATFEALSVTFDWANLEFGERFLPWVRLACEWLQRDYIGTQSLVRDMLRNEGERLSHEIFRFTSLNQVSMTAVKAVADSLKKSKGSQEEA